MSLSSEMGILYEFSRGRQLEVVSGQLGRLCWPEASWGVLSDP